MASELRNRIAWRLANAALRLATPTYRLMIGGAVRYGLDSAARDIREDRIAPPAFYPGPLPPHGDPLAGG